MFDSYDAGNGADVYDAAVPREQEWKGRLGYQKHRLDVHVHQTAEVFDVGVEDVADMADAGVVDENVEAGMARMRRRSMRVG